PGGVVTPEVKARYLKLWAHRTGAAKAEDAGRRADDGGRRTDDGGRPAEVERNLAGYRGKQRPLVAAIAASAVIIGAAGVWLYYGRKSGPTVPPTPAAKS